MAKILLVEDDEPFALMVAEWLAFDHHSVEIVNSGQEGLSRVHIGSYDIILLDWALPEIEGIEICKQFRAHGGDTPIIMLTGKDAVPEIEKGLDSGADDYLTKPFNINELSARIRALLRRSSRSQTNTLRVGDLEIDISKYTVTKNGEEIHLLPREFALLEFLMRHPGEVFSGDQLLQRVWHTESDATIEAIRTCVKRLRKKLDSEDDEEKSIIETIPRVGYRLRAKKS